MAKDADVAPLDQHEELTARHREVLALLAKGATNFEIAEALGISLEGAKYHVREITGRLGVESREEAAAWWRKHKRPSARMHRALAWLAPRLAVAASVFAALAASGLVVAVAVSGVAGGRPAAAYVSLCGEGDLTLAAESELRDQNLFQTEDPAVEVRVRISTREMCYLNGELTLGPEPFDAAASPFFPASTSFDTILEGEASATFTVRAWCDAYTGTELTARLRGVATPVTLDHPGIPCDQRKSVQCTDEAGSATRCPTGIGPPATFIRAGNGNGAGWVDLLPKCNPALLRPSLDMSPDPQPPSALLMRPGTVRFALTFTLPERPLDCEFVSAMSVRLIDAHGRDIELAEQSFPFTVRFRRAKAPDRTGGQELHVPGTGSKGDFESETALISFESGTQLGWTSWCGEGQSPVTVELTTAIGRVSGQIDRPPCNFPGRATILGPE